MAANANTQIYDKTIDRAAMIRLYERRVDGKVQLVIDGHAVRVDKLIREAERSDKGLLRLREAIDQDLKRTYEEAFSVSKRSLVEFADDQASFTYGAVSESLSDVWRAERAPVISEEIVLGTPLYNNKTLEQGWRGIRAGERKRLEAVIRRGIAGGWQVGDIADEVRRSSVVKISRTQARGLVVTAITSVRSQVDQRIYQANAKAIRGWQYVAVLDSRTTPLCAHRDGTIYPPDDTRHLPPAHFHCRSTTVPVFKSWDDMANLEGVAQVRRRNIAKLTKQQLAFYDGQTPMRETYGEWLKRQPEAVQLRHLGDYKKIEMLRSGELELKQFTNDAGNSIGIRELRRMTDAGYTIPGDTRRFAIAKEKLDAMRLWATTPDDLISDGELRDTLRDYYVLQSKDLNGTLSLTNFRGTLIGVKKGVKQRVLHTPPTEKQLVFNPATGRYEDIRLYRPTPEVYQNAMRLVKDSEKLTQADKDFIKEFVESLDQKMGVNERAVVAENLRVVIGRFRESGEPWTNFKAVVQGQIKFDVMNVSDALETQLRKNTEVLKKLLQDNYIDPVLGPAQLAEIDEKFVDNILERNLWEDRTAPKIARELRSVFDYRIAEVSPVIWKRLDDSSLQQFYLKFAHRLSLADMPDRDQFAVALGRDLHNLANLNGRRNDWYELGMKLLEAKNVRKFFEVETYGVQKRRMRSRMSGKYFGPYYDTLSYNIRITDSRIQRYAKLNRMIDVGLRIPRTSERNRLWVRPGYKTYWIKRGPLGWEDTRIPITSTSSFGDFPTEFIDEEFADALNWASQARYRVDEDYHDFIRDLLYFEDDRGKAKYYNELNEYRKHISARGDAYERFKTMEWLRSRGAVFSNHHFVDHRARIYERGFIGPQAGETYRPFLNTAEARSFSELDFLNFRDQVGGFLGGLSDHFEGRFNALSFTGRQKVAQRWWPELVKLGNHMRRRKPADIRAVLESDVASRVDGDDIGKFYRLALEAAKIDEFLGGDYSKKSLARLTQYKTALAMEQDASSSGAQIIALTTKNKRLAELSNVVNTGYKQRLYDEVTSATYNDPRFRRINERLGLTEKDLRKAAKYQNMVTLYGAGERTAAFQVEKYLAKPLGKQKNVLVVTASDRDVVLNEISARMARFERFDPEAYAELKMLRDNVKDVFNKGLEPGDDLMEQLWFLDPKTYDLVEKMTAQYSKVVTPDDFKAIAQIMSEYLAEKTPILRDFTRFFGRLAEDFLTTAKPSSSDFDWKTIVKTTVRGTKKKGYVLPDEVSRVLGLKAGEPVSEKVLKRFGFWRPDGTLSQIIYGVPAPETRRTGAKYFKVEVAKVKNLYEFELFYANKLPKSWTNVPWVNFDGKILEQNYTQTFEERLAYKDVNGEWVINILQVPQKTEATWWEQVVNKDGKINDIADVTRARTAFAVNGNHSNDATIVKNFHLWGRKEGVETATVHDAFFTNITDMLRGRKALKQIYARTLDRNVIKDVLDEMKARGLPKETYDRYLEEAMDLGLIPVPGRSVVGGKVVTEKDILRKEDLLDEIEQTFEQDYGWYGVG